MTKGGHVHGITCLRDELFVVRNRRAEVEVYKYNVDSIILKSRLPVTGLMDPWDLASCPRSYYLYICDSSDCFIYTLQLKGNVVRNWILNSNPQSLSVTAQSNVIVSFCSLPILKEFTKDGQTVRDIQLNQNVQSPLHTVLLKSGQLLLSHIGSQHRICSVGDDGQVTQFYGGRPGSAAGQIQYPNHLVVDTQGYILVADRDNNRVVLLSPSLMYIKELIPPGYGVKGPSKLCFDQQLGLLFIVEENSRSRVSVYTVTKNMVDI